MQCQIGGNDMECHRVHSERLVLICYWKPIDLISFYIGPSCVARTLEWQVAAEFEFVWFTSLLCMFHVVFFFILCDFAHCAGNFQLLNAEFWLTEFHAMISTISLGDVKFCVSFRFLPKRDVS